MYRNIIRADLQQFIPYSSARMQNVSSKILLNANESPWDELNGYNRYPEQQPERCVKALATLFGVDQNQLLVTRGSDEGIDLLIRLCCTANQDAIMINPPTYGMYQVYANLQSCSAILAPGSIEQMMAVWRDDIKLVFLCNPNNPTGQIIDQKEIIALCKRLEGKALVVVDEAYIEFADITSMTNQLNNNPNLVVLRTLSKAYGLAGIRCGAVLANPLLISWLKKIMAPYPIALPVIECITTRLCNVGITRVQQQIETIKREREQLYCKLSSLPFINKVWPSQTNFILFEPDESDQLYDFLSQHQLAVRYFKTLSAIRVSIGTSIQNQTLITLLEKFGGEQ